MLILIDVAVEVIDFSILKSPPFLSLHNLLMCSNVLFRSLVLNIFCVVCVTLFGYTVQ